MPVHCFGYGTLFSSSDPFHGSVASLDDAVTRGNVRTAEPESDSPLVQEILKQAAAKGSVVIR